MSVATLNLVIEVVISIDLENNNAVDNINNLKIMNEFPLGYFSFEEYYVNLN